MSTSAVARNLHASQYKPTRLALDLVKNIIAKRGPIETKTLYELSQKAQLTPAQLQENALEQQAMASGRPGVADQLHPVRSISFLKRSIMPVLLELNEVEKVHVRHKVRSPIPNVPEAADAAPLPRVEVSSWPWQIKQLKAPKPKEIFEPASIAAALGKDADWGHLNKRRRRRREEKINVSLKWANDLNKIRRTVAVEKAENAHRQQVEKAPEIRQARLEKKAIEESAKQAQLAEAASAPPSAPGGQQPSAP
ncbi:hypothetical protein FIBSPDRAFT_1052507 [Athelia psychrophila]|uniref:Uncharacterized protein n=1 Tax=Athelia psychrophila TaxID=1759441 RepID=A0A165X7X5_9AGAM|nr:hypothetical protein FIBSPDRAFT_1052507 [Fibularhizoctonia sp. CBS 109695]